MRIVGLMASGVAIAAGGLGVFTFQGTATASPAGPPSCEYAVDGGFTYDGSKAIQAASYWYRRDVQATRDVFVMRRSAMDAEWHAGSSMRSLGKTAQYGGSVADSIGMIVPVDLVVMMPEGWVPPSGWNWNRWQSQGGVSCKRVPHEWIDVWDVAQGQNSH
jgi:hypothetical protein